MKSNNRVKQMICDALEFADPTYEDNPVYRWRFGKFYCLDENDAFQIQPYQLCNDGYAVTFGVISLTANQLKGNKNGN